MAETVKKLKVQLSTDNSKLKSGLKQSEQQVNKFSSSLKKMGVALGGAFALTKITSFFKESVKLYGIQEKAEKKLADSIKATGGAVDTLLPRYKKLASDIQKVTTVGDETTIGLIALGKQMKITDADMEKATKGAIGLSKAFGIDLNTSMKMVAAAIQGDTTLLNRYIPALRFATTEAEKMAIVNEAMANGWQVATGEVDTFTGRMEQLSNTMGDIREKIGGAIAETMTEPLKDLSAWVSENEGMIVGFFTVLIGVVKEAGTAISGLNKTTQNWASTLSGMDKFFDEQKKGILENAEALKKYNVGQIKAFRSNALEVVNKAMKETNQTAAEMILNMFGAAKATEKLGESTEDLDDTVEEITRDYTSYNKVLEANKKQADELAEVNAALAEGIDLTTEEIDQSIVMGEGWENTALDMADASEDLKKGVDNLGDGFSGFNIDLIDTISLFGDILNLSDGVINSLTGIGEGFARFASGDVISGAMQIAEAMGETLVPGFNISGDELSRGFGSFFSEFSGMFDDMGIDINEFQKIVKENLDNIDGEMVLALMQSPAKYQAFLSQVFMQMQRDMGMFAGMMVRGGGEVVEAFKGMGGAAQQVGNEVASAFRAMGGAVEGFGNQLSGLPGSGDALNINTPNTGRARPGVGSGFADGANFVVPQGFEGDSFPMRVSSGEHVKVTPAGQGGGDITLNVNLSVGSGTNGKQLADEFIQELRLNQSNLQKEIRAVV